MADVKTTISVFLGSSHELEPDQRILCDFVAELNRIMLDRGVFFRLVSWQWDGRNDPLKDYDAAVRGSSLALFLYFMTSDDAMEERFRQALEAFRANGAPQIVTWFKVVPQGGSISCELERFRNQLDTELHHFYNTYETLDTVKLGVLLQIARDVELDSAPDEMMGKVAGSFATGGTAGGLSVRDDTMYLDGRALVNLADVPAYRGWRAIADARAALDAFEPQYQAAKARQLEAPDNDEAARAYGDAAARRAQLTQALEQAQRQFLSFMRTMTHDTATGARLTARQRQAYRLVEAGKIDEAIALLDEAEIRADRARAEQDLAVVDAERDRVLERLRATVAEQLQLADLLTAHIEDTATVERIETALAEAAACEAAHGLGFTAQAEFGSFLFWHNRYNEARPYLEAAERVCDEWEHAGVTFSDEQFTARINTLKALGTLLSDECAWDDALAVSEHAVEVARRAGALWRILLAWCLRTKAVVLSDMHRFEDALATLDEAEAVVSPLPHPERLEASLQLSRGVVLRQSWRPREALCAYKRAVDLIRVMLAARDSDDNRFNLAIALGNAGTACTSLNQHDAAQSYFREAAELLRDLAARDPGRYDGDFARSLAELGDNASTFRRYEESEAWYLQALAIRRRLFEQNPAAFGEDYAITLNNLGSLYWKVGRLADGERLLRECVTLRRPWARENLAVFGEMFSSSLAQLSGVYRELGQNALAEQYIREGVSVMRALARLQPGMHDHRLVYRLLDLALLLEQTDANEALPVYEEARAVAQAAQDAGKAGAAGDAADVLHNEALCLDKAGQHERAIAMLEDARARYRALHEAQPDVVYREDYARCLGNTGALYNRAGQTARAETAYSEAMGILRELAADGNPYYRDWLVRTLRSWADLARHEERWADAAARYDEAAVLYERTAGWGYTDVEDATSIHSGDADAPSRADAATEGVASTGAGGTDDAQRDLDALSRAARMRWWQAWVLDKQGRFDEGLSAYERAVEQYRTLYEMQPDEAYRKNIAECLDNIGLLCDRAGKTARAEAAYGEAVTVFRKLAANDESGYQDRLARTLRRWADVARRGEHWADAAGRYGEAAELYERAAGWGSDAATADVGDEEGELHDHDALSQAARMRWWQAWVLDKQGRLDEALSTYKRAVELYRVLGDKKSLASCYYNASFAFRDPSCDEALTLLENALVLRLELYRDGKMKGEELRKVIERLQRQALRHGATDPAGAIASMNIATMSAKLVALRAPDAFADLERSAQADLDDLRQRAGAATSDTTEA